MRINILDYLDYLLTGELHTEDEICLHGRLSLEFNHNGQTWTESGDNMIVNTGRLGLFQGLASVANKFIAKVQIGTNDTTPALTDTAITAPVDITITSQTATPTGATIGFTIGSATGNGTTFNEFGLILADGTLFSRKSWTPINKIADLTINGTWVISFI